MKIRKGYCAINADINVVTKYPGKRPAKRGAFEKGIEQVLMDGFFAYIKGLAGRYTSGESMEWVTRAPNVIEFVKKKTARA